ncbi:MAG: NAD(+) diphosphatase [Rubrivivax sp.]
MAPLAPASPLAWCFVFVEGQILPVDDAAPFSPHAASSLVALLAQAERRHYLGRLEGDDAWALALAETPPGWRRSPLRAAMMQFDEPLMALAGRAAQVLEWDRTHRHCGACGTLTELAAGERARRCPACGHTAYPRVSPAMMVLVWRPVEGKDGEGGRHEFLLARSPHYAPGVYSALAGFVEAGESLEDCVHREVAEEVGVRVGELAYYGSQSWPFPHSLMVAYTARWLEGGIVPQAGEIEDARWYALDALPKIPPRFSISGHLIRDTVRALGGPQPVASASPVNR